MTKPKILIICPFFPPNIGGVESHLEELTKILAKKKFMTTVLTYKPLTTRVKKYLAVERKDNLAIYRFWWWGVGIFDKLTPWPMLQFLYIVPGLLIRSVVFCLSHRGDFDIVHCHGLAASVIGMVIKKIWLKKKLIISTHYIYQKLTPKSIYAKVFKYIFDKADQILTVSQKSSQELIKIGLKQEKIKQFYHWLDPDEFRKVGMKSVDFPAKMRVLFMGRIITMKGVFKLYQAAKKLPKEIVFLIAGDGPDFLRLKNLKPLNNFKILGKVDRKKIIELLSISDLMILPSLKAEGSPVSVMEALMVGTPVATTNLGSATEMYDKSVGVTFKPEINEIEKVIKDLYNNPEKLKKMAKNSRPYALENYGLKNSDIIINTYAYI